MIDLNNYTESTLYDEAEALYRLDAIRPIRDLDRPSSDWSWMTGPNVVVLANAHWVLAAYDLWTSEAISLRGLDLRNREAA